MSKIYLASKESIDSLSTDISSIKTALETVSTNVNTANTNINSIKTTVGTINTNASNASTYSLNVQNRLGTSTDTASQTGTTVQSKLRYVANSIADINTNASNASTYSKNVQDRLGTTSDSGGSASAGSAMAKLNAIYNRTSNNISSSTVSTYSKPYGRTIYHNIGTTEANTSVFNNNLYLTYNESTFPSVASTGLTVMDLNWTSSTSNRTTFQSLGTLNITSYQLKATPLILLSLHPIARVEMYGMVHVVVTLVGNTSNYTQFYPIILSEYELNRLMQYYTATSITSANTSMPYIIYNGLQNNVASGVSYYFSRNMFLSPGFLYFGYGSSNSSYNPIHTCRNFNVSIYSNYTYSPTNAIQPISSSLIAI